MPPKPIIRHKFPENTTGQDFRNQEFSDVDGLKAQFENCDFSFSIFNRAYFRQAVFKDCKFTGCRFTDSIFSNARISGCHFDYASFRHTDVDTKEILSNLPDQANIRRRLLRNLRINALEVGNFSDAREFFVREMDAHQEHYWKQWRNEDTYNSKKHRGLAARLKAWLKCRSIQVSWLLWNHAESPLRFFAWIAVVVLFLTAAMHFQGDVQLRRANVDDTSFRGALFFTTTAFLGMSFDLVPVTRTARMLAVIDATAGYVTLGLLVVLAHRALTKR